ncbi:hypothetical protein JCM10207_000301 [Rhodosporidiobolus poonsookiae]
MVDKPATPKKGAKKPAAKKQPQKGKAAAKKNNKKAADSDEDEVSDDPDAARLPKNLKKKEKVQPTASDDEREAAGIYDNADASEDEAPKTGPKKKAAPRKSSPTPNKAAKAEALDFSLPPITDINSVFSDLTSGFADELAKVMKKLGRPLRVATMCSGTEAPILALRLIFRHLEEQTGIKASMHHVFSAEIEPFKQAYIERNFAPPLLFRDVTELPNKQARTAYGAMVDVPGGADILIAGTSCVDYSNLNNLKKGLYDGGESSRTFLGMLNWVEQHQPPIVILENVLNAPWKDGAKAFDDIDYHTTFAKFDTKKYYIPHTRLRGYMVAFPKNTHDTDKMESFFAKKSSKSKDNLSAEDMGDMWAERVAKAARSASAPTEAFLLNSDDPRILRAREELSHIKLNADGSRRAAAAWAKCEQRHAQARHQEELGNKRPLTDWQDGGGKPTLPDGAWQDWGEAQTERVLDLMDISYLRNAKNGVDITFKSAIWNLSQNVDRTTASKLFGITPCLTPNMIPYLTNRGGPVVGLEALALQGLPIDELLLTRETTDELANLAGNAMSSTVVGTAMAAALCIAGHTLLDREYAKEDATMEEVADVAAIDEEVEARFRGSERLVDHPVDLASVKPAPADLLARAFSSARRCVCEGRMGLSQHPIQTCEGCGHSTCSKHAGKPVHRFPDTAAMDVEREQPASFEADLKEILPMRLTLRGFDKDKLEALVAPAEEKGANFDEDVVERYFDLVSSAIVGAEFHFRHLDRRETWAAVYVADKARLELHFEATGLEWRLFVSPPPDLSMLNELRRQLEHPVARIKLPVNAEEIIADQWEIKLPMNKVSAIIKMDFGDKDSFVPSWRSNLGLDQFKDEKRPSTISIKFEGNGNILARPLDGKYVLEAQCGTATNSLYRRADSDDATPLYFFFDPSAYLQEEHDAFVFAENCARLETTRPLIAALSPKWRLPTSSKASNAETSPQIVVAHVWSALDGASIAPGAIDVGEESRFSTIKTGFELSIADGTCSQAEDLLLARVPLAEAPSTVWAKETWHEVDVQHEGADVFNKLAWMLARIPEWQNLKDWQTVEASSVPEENCACCAPVMPEVMWIRQLMLTTKSKQLCWRPKIIAREDGKESDAYERALKARPEPILIHTRQKGQSFELRVGLNVVSLAHRALAQLPIPSDPHQTRSTPVVEWRLASSANIELGRQKGHVFSLKSNRNDPEAENPSIFTKFKLRPEQLRSLHWMLKQEQDPQPWVEQEVAEAPLSQLGWHAEAKATREAIIRGGVVADAVGYGKTAITLGLIAARLKEDARLPKSTDRIAIKATLIIVPSQLTAQWPAEVKKFTGSALKVLTIKSMADLKKKTIDDFRDANIIVVADTLFKSELFWPQLADFGGAKRDIRTDKNAGRFFRYAVNAGLEALGEQVKLLRTEGSVAVLKNIRKARKSRNEDFQEEAFIPETRKKANDNNRKKGKKVEKLPPKPTSYPRAKNQTVNDNDWQLDSSRVVDDYNEMKCPPLTMFSYARVVVDEFSYTEGAPLAGIHALRARSRWILSGTPPLDDFSHIKGIAEMLHVDIGCHDDNEGTAKAVKVRADERTKAEAFRSYCDVRTKAWHARRDEVAQRFLDQFARQNVAEIEDIPLTTELVGVRLPGAEMAIYRELEHHLTAVDPGLAKIAKVKADQQGDREKRLKEALGKSKTPEEALLKRCSHFSLDLPASKAQQEAPDVCDFIFDLREKQLRACEDQVKGHLAMVAYKHRKAMGWGLYKDRPQDPIAFEKFVTQLEEVGFGDSEANESIKRLAGLAGVKDGEILHASEVLLKPKKSQVEKFNKAYGNRGPWDDYCATRTYEIRSDCAVLRQLCKELTGRYRSKRYFEAVRNVIRPAEASGSKDADVAILSCCGHQGTAQAVQEAARTGNCMFAADGTCGSQVFSHNVVLGDDLGSDRSSGYYGYKLETLVTLIQQTPKNDKVIVFVQFNDLFDKVHEALSVYEIPTLVLQGTANQKSKQLSHFQDEKAKDTKVILLLATDSSASGANLTIANHAFFVSPLQTDTKSKYKALSTQAVGRIHRFGQNKTAHIYHLLVHGTLDVKVYGERNDLGDGRIEKTLIDGVNEVMKKQEPQRDEVVNPRRKTTGKYTKLKRKKTKKEKEYDDDSDSDDGKAAEEEEEEDDDDEEEAASDVEQPKSKKERAKTPASPVKPAAVKGRGKKKEETLVVDDSSAEESGEGSDDEEDEESAVETDDEGAGSIRGGDNDEFELDLTGDSPPPAKREPRARRSVTTTQPKYAVDDDEEDEEDKGEEDEAEKRAQSPSPQTKKRRRVIAESDDEEEEEEEAPVASTSKAAAASSQKSKAKVPASSQSQSQSQSQKGKGKATASPDTKRRKFEIVVPPRKKGIPAPPRSPAKNKKQATLASFFGKKPAAPAPAATAKSVSASASNRSASASPSKEPSPILDQQTPVETPAETPATEVDRELGMQVDEE